MGASTATLSHGTEGLIDFIRAANILAILPQLGDPGPILTPTSPILLCDVIVLRRSEIVQNFLFLPYGNWGICWSTTKTSAMFVEWEKM
jgi:hypothetical protein